jgi:hypothetical protein
LYQGSNTAIEMVAFQYQHLTEWKYSLGWILPYNTPFQLYAEMTALERDVDTVALPTYMAASLTR